MAVSRQDGWKAVQAKKHVAIYHADAEVCTYRVHAVRAISSSGLQRKFVVIRIVSDYKLAAAPGVTIDACRQVRLHLKKQRVVSNPLSMYGT